MKVTTMTLLIALVSCIQIWRTVLRVRRRTLGVLSALFWIALWFSIGYGSLFPATMDYFMAAAQMGDRMLFILLFAVLVLFALLFDLSSRLEKTVRDLARIAQDVALLRDAKDGKHEPLAAERLRTTTADAGGGGRRAPRAAGQGDA